MSLFCYNQRVEYYPVLNINQLNIIQSAEYHPVIFPRYINWLLFHHCDISYCNVIYLNRSSLFNLASTCKVVNFLSKSSTSIGLLIVHNGAVISEKNYDNNQEKKQCKNYFLHWIELSQLKGNNFECI